MTLRLARLALVLGLMVVGQGCCMKCCDPCACMGCGEKYWGDWHENPPIKPDPCDCCGNYIGPQSCGCGCGGHHMQASYGGGGEIYSEVGHVPTSQVFQYEGEGMPQEAMRPTPAPSRPATRGVARQSPAMARMGR